MRKIIALAVVVALSALVLAPSAFAADKIQDQLQLQLKDGSCTTCPCELL